MRSRKGKINFMFPTLKTKNDFLFSALRNKFDFMFYPLIKKRKGFKIKYQARTKSELSSRAL